MTKVILVHHTGGPDVLSFEGQSVGAPGPGQGGALRQTAIGLNFIDTYQRSGLYSVQTPFVADNEGAGVITALGDGASNFKPGDRIVYQRQIGVYAAERLVAADRIVLIPDSIDDQTAATVLLKGLTAYYLLFQTWPVAKGEAILRHAAAGGAGLIATQWTKYLGATVIGAAGSDDKTALARAHGCDHVINYNTEDFAARVREITNGRGVVGKATFEKSLDCLRPRGLLASFGNASGVVSIHDITVLARKGSLYVTRPTGVHYLTERPALLAGAKLLFEAIASGAIKVQVNHTFVLAEAAQAHRALEGRQTTGSVVLIP